VDDEEAVDVWCTCGLCGFFLGFAGFFGVVVVVFVAAARDVWVVVECVAAAPPQPANPMAAAMMIGGTRRMDPFLVRSTPCAFRVQNQSDRESSRCGGEIGWAKPGHCRVSRANRRASAANTIAAMRASGSSLRGPELTPAVATS
jgi:hypothetical protein